MKVIAFDVSDVQTVCLNRASARENGWELYAFLVIAVMIDPHVYRVTQ